MIKLLFSLLKITVIEMAYMIGLLLAAGLILGLFERLSNTLMQRSFGKRGILATAWLGTPIHELGHATMCVLFRHRITRVKLLNINSENGVLGYVEHSYNPNSLYQNIGNLFIGLGPIFSGMAAIIISMYFLIPKSFNVFKGYVLNGIQSDKIDSSLVLVVLNAGGNLIKSIFTYKNLSNLNFWIFIIIAICVSSHIALSRADIKGAERGFLTLFILILLLNTLLRYFSLSTAHYIIQLGRYNAHFIAFLMLALIFSAFTLSVTILCYLLSSFRKV